MRTAEANVDEARSIGLIASDLDAMREAIVAVTGADRAQEDARATAPLTTRERNHAARRVAQSTDRIIAAGVLQFASEPSKRAEFEAFDRSRREEATQEEGGVATARSGGGAPSGMENSCAAR